MRRDKIEFKKNKPLLFKLLIFFLGVILSFQVIGVFKARRLKKIRQDCNVILIFIDALRADHLGCYGYSRNTAPNIDKLAKESIIFEQNYTPATYTLASFASLVTSLYPKSHGVFFIAKDKYPLKVKTLPEIVKSYDYKTAWFGPPKEGVHLNPEIGIRRGYDKIDEFTRTLDTSRKTVSDWIEENKDRKFFLAFHTYFVHSPYMPSLKYKKKFTAEENNSIADNMDRLDKLTFEYIKKELSNKESYVWEVFGEELVNEFIKNKLLKGDFTPDAVKQIYGFLDKRKEIYKLDYLKGYVYHENINLKDENIKKYVEALYDGGILEFDTEVIGPVLAKLKELRIYDKTIIIIFSDHGEEFGEHGGYTHGSTLYNEVTHVPLIIRVPWIKRNRRIKEMTQTVDVMPTFLDLLNIPLPHYAQGKSLINLMEGRENLPLREYVFGQHFEKSYISSKTWKLILLQDKPKELYHLPSDPGENHNLYEERQDIASELEKELKKWEESLPSYQDEDYPFAPAIDEAAQERIKKTGYW